MTDFYERRCGFVRTPAGLLELTGVEGPSTRTLTGAR